MLPCDFEKRGLLPCPRREVRSTYPCAVCALRPAVAAAIRAERAQDGEAREALERLVETEWMGLHLPGDNHDHYYCPLCRAHGPEDPPHEPRCPYLAARAYLARPAPEPSPEPAAEGAREDVRDAAELAYWWCPDRPHLDGARECRTCRAMREHIEAYAAERARRRDGEWARALGIAPDDTWWSRALADPETAAEYVAERRRVAVGEALEEAEREAKHAAVCGGSDYHKGYMDGRTDAAEAVRALKERER